MKLTIDLTQEFRGLAPVDFPWKIRMPEPEQPSFFKRCFKRLFGCGRRVTEQTHPLIVVINNIKVPQHLDCNRDKLFIVSYGDQDHTILDRPFRVQMTTVNKVPFDLKFNLDAVFDCVGEDTDMVVRAEMLIYDGNRIYGENILSNDLLGFPVEQRINVYIDIELKCPKIIPEILIDLDDEEFQFTRQMPLQKIGQLRVKNNRQLKFLPKLTVNLHLLLFGSNKKEINGALKLGERREEDGLLFVQDICLDMRKLSNPWDDEEYEIECTGNFSVIGDLTTDGMLTPKYTSFILKRDRQGSELEVYIDEINLVGKNNANRKHLLKQINFTLGSQLMRRYKMVFKNLSSDDSVSGAGVEISNLAMDVKVKGARLFDKNGNDITNHVMNLSGYQLPAMKSGEGLFLPNGIGDSQTTLTLTFTPQDIANIEWEQTDLFLFSIICNIDFHYVENRDGENTNLLEKKEFHTTLEQRVFLEPYPEWLCVDYGTSAIVSVYDGKLLDLHKQKISLIARDSHYKQFTNDNYENGSLFLSSDILLHEVAQQNEEGTSGFESSLSSEQKRSVEYSQLAVCLSPTSSMTIAQFVYQLPCLKMLVGRELLPSNPNYNIQYYHKKDDNIERVHAKDIPIEDSASLISVMNVFRESYHTLFRYFILPEIGDLQHLNRLVLTYPNAYTPLHLSMIRQVVRQTFPSIRFDQNCLRFVSESDAVAAYYMRHWNEYHAEGEDINQDENVLVFDMGAGTLDVTLLQKKYIDGNHELRIIGKLGTCKAGNYLDYVIAQILCDKLKLNPLIVSTGDAQTEINNSIAMKLAIKSQIKPKLSETNPSNIEFQLGTRKLEIRREDIIAHRLFTQYLEDTTTSMLQQMCQYMDKSLLSIDTVLMSGRSCRLTLLQESLQQAVSKLNSQSNCEFITLDTPVNANVQIKDRQKTAVAEGAIAVAEMFSQPSSPVRILSKRLYANYGIAYQGVQNQWKYVELLNHKGIPTDSTKGEYQFEGVTIKGVGISPDIRLVQSYLNPKETTERLNKKDYEYLSIMGVFSKSNYKSELHNGDELNACIVLTENDEVALCIGQMQSVGRTPNGTDLESEVTKRSFWPVRITF